MATKEKPRSITVEGAVKKRTRTVPRSAFKAGGPNPHAFKKGQPSANPSGRPRDEVRLLSKAVRRQLADRAPNEAAQKLGLDAGASWAMVLAATLIRRAVAGSMPAAELLVTMTEPVRTSLAIGAGVVDEFGDVVAPPSLTILFDERPAPGLPHDYVHQPHPLDRPYVPPSASALPSSID